MRPNGSATGPDDRTQSYKSYSISIVFIHESIEIKGSPPGEGGTIDV